MSGLLMIGSAPLWAFEKTQSDRRSAPVSNFFGPNSQFMLLPKTDRNEGGRGSQRGAQVLKFTGLGFRV